MSPVSVGSTMRLMPGPFRYRNPSTLAIHPHRDLLSRNHKRAGGAVPPIPIVEKSQVVVVGQREKVIAVISIPGGYLLRLGVAVRLGSVRVYIAPVPDLFVHIKRLYFG